MSSPPTYTLTFLFTDIAGSTRLWEEHPAAMVRAHARHGEIVVEAVNAHRGRLVRMRGEGDSTFSVFDSAPDALAAACAMQRALHREEWPAETPVRVRAALHSGVAVPDGHDYNSTAVNRCARLRALASAGQTLLSQTTADLVGHLLPEGASLLDLGAHRLKDLSRPEQVYQLVHPDLPGEFPPLRSLETLPTNLPQQASSFIGRERELEDVCRLLARTRLLTLAAPGGAGKTRLAIHAAAEVLEEYPDGVWLVDLSVLTDPARLLDAVAAAVGVHEEAGTSLQETLLGHLRGRRVLLVLDNCEHLVDACADLVSRLLRVCAHLRVMATSREALNIDGEVIYRVPALSLPEAPPVRRSGALSDDAGLDPEKLLSYAAPRLFVERARAARRDFALTPRSAAAVARICRRLDGIPLALELAAARIKMLSAEQIAARLEDRFRLLTGGGRTAPARQQTLRGAIDWSYELLTEPERALLARLSVFAGGWTLAAAEEVCAGTPIDEFEVMDLLGSLVDKSLVVTEEGDDETRFRFQESLEVSDEGDGETRFRFLETLREYAAERLEETPDAEELHRRHRDHWLEVAEGLAPEITGPDPAPALDRLETEHENLRAALRWSLEAAGETEAALRLCAALGDFWGVRGHWTEGSDWCAQALKRCEGAHAAELRTAVLLFASRFATLRDRYEEARALAEQALAISQETNDAEREAESHRLLGGIARSAGDYPLARSEFERGARLFRESGNVVREAMCLQALGNVAFDEGEPARASALFQESSAAFAAAGLRRLQTKPLAGLAALAYEAGDYQTARDSFQEILAIHRELGDLGEIARALGNLGVIAGAMGDADVNWDLLQQALELNRQLGDMGGVAGNLCNLGVLAAQDSRFGDPGEYYRQALETYRELGARADESLCLAGLAGAAARRQDYLSAQSSVNEALIICRETGVRAHLPETLDIKGQIETLIGRPHRAARIWGAMERASEAVSQLSPAAEWNESDHRIVNLAREALGEEAFNAAWAEGRAMTADEVLEYALDETD